MLEFVQFVVREKNKIGKKYEEFVNLFEKNS